MPFYGCTEPIYFLFSEPNPCRFSLAPFDTFSTPWKWGKMRENGVKALKISTNVKCFVVENPAG